MFDTFSRVRDPNGRKKLECNSCRRETIHNLEAQCIGKWEEDGPQTAYGGTEFSLYRCGACDEVCFESSSWFSELFDHDDRGELYLIREEAQFPPPSSADFAFATDFTPQELNELIDEMLYALAGSKLKLATVALRMVIEFIVKDAKCEGSDLYHKIENLHEKGMVNPAQLSILHRIREKGNAGAHDRIAMNRSEMVAGIGIVNLMLEKIYNIPAREAAIVKKGDQVFNTNDAS